MPVTVQSVHNTSQEPQNVRVDYRVTVKSSWHSLFAFTTREHTAGITIALVSTLASALFRPAAAIFFGKIFSILTKFGAGTVTAQDTLHGVVKWCTALVGLGGAAWIVEWTFLSSWMAFGEAQAKNVRHRTFEGMLDKDIEWFDSRQDGIGSLLTRIQTQIRELQLATSQPLGFLAYEIFGSMASLGLAFYFSWKLTFVIIAVFPIAGIILYMVSMPLSPAIEAQKRELTKASKYSNIAFEAIDTVKAYSGQDQEVWQYYSTIKSAASNYIIQARINALQFGFTKLFMVGIFVQGFWFGLYLVDHGMDPGDVLTTFYACLAAMQSVETVLPQWLVIAKGVSAGHTLKSMMVQMKHGRKVTHMAGLTKPTSSPGDIEVNEVSFAYPSNLYENVLNNATFFFPAGEMTFVVGKSGSGKSTLGNLLMKYYDPLRGEILIDGHSIQTLDVDWLRHNVTLVQQQSVLFNETVYQNIAFGRKDHVTVEDVLKASKTGDLGQTIMDLPEGLETLVRSNGKSLSGGQQQRIAIARARLRDAPIVILDEATSALDQTSKQKVMEEIRKWREKKTTIVITHDVSQIRDDEYVYVLDRGVVVQEGYCQKLAEKEHGTFASLHVVHTQETNSRISRLRRISDPVSPTAASPDGKLGHRWKYASKIFGMNDSGTPSSIQRDELRIGRASYNAGVVFGYRDPSDAFWTTQTRPPDIFHSPQLGTFRPNSLGFLTSRPQSLASFQDLSNRPVARDSITISVATGTNSAKSGRPRPVSPAIDSLPKRPGLSPVKSQQSVNPFRNIQSTPKDVRKIQPASFSKILATIWPTLSWNMRIYFSFGFFAAFIVAASTPGFAYVFARLLEIYYLPGNRANQAKIWALALLAIACIDGMATFCMHYALECTGQAWVNELRVEALKRILAQPRSWFDKEKNSAARLNECLDRNAEEMRNMVGRFTAPVFTSVWMLGISIIWAFIISWKLSLVAVGCGPVVYGITRLSSHISSKWEEKCNVLSAQASDIFTETFSNIRVVRALTLESHFKRKHSLTTKNAYKTGLYRAMNSGFLFGLGDSASFFITATIFYYGTVIIANGSLTVSSVLEVVTLLVFGISNSLSILSLIPQLSSSRTTATHMLKLSRLSLRSQKGHETRRLASPFPIHLNNLNFTYPSSSHQRTLSSITLTIKSGICTAIVGSSGSGKSTLSSIILALYAPDAVPPDNPPPLTFAGIPISQCNIVSLRGHIAIVPQSPILFPTTILQNIIYGLPEGSSFSSLEAAALAARDAGIHEFISSLPNSYNTVVGEGGQGLSGGQAQRIAIARALVRRPKVLILDEATSALDTMSAEIVRKTVRRLIERGRESGEGGMAVLVIAHDVEMMRICERIVVLEAGTIAEIGSFEELKRREGAFCRLIGGIPGACGLVMEQDRVMSPTERRNRGTWMRKGSV